MKAILEFNMDEFDDVMAHKRAVMSTDMALAIWEIVYNMKRSFENKIDEGKYEGYYDLLDDVFKAINEELQDIPIDKLIV